MTIRAAAEREMSSDSAVDARSLSDPVSFPAVAVFSVTYRPRESEAATFNRPASLAVSRAAITPAGWLAMYSRLPKISLC